MISRALVLNASALPTVHHSISAISVIRWPNYFSIFSHLEQWKLAQLQNLPNTKYGLIKLPKIEISPNLVELLAIVTYLGYVKFLWVPRFGKAN